jgi:hypothetical protein
MVCRIEVIWTCPFNAFPILALIQPTPSALNAIRPTIKMQ